VFVRERAILSGLSELVSRRNLGRVTQMLTPKTMPVGKMIPHAIVWIRIWVHNIESMGSTEIAWPSSMLSVWWSCAKTTVLRSSAAVATA
jgi:hypothetical protein